MEYVTFNIWQYPKFIEWGTKHEARTWQEVFEIGGYTTASIQNGHISMREDEYSWFLLRWLCE